MTAGGTWGVAPTRRIIRALLRALGSIAVLVAAYYILPLDRTAAWAAVLMLVVGLAVLIALIMYQVRSIARTKYPRLRAIEALATSVPFLDRKSTRLNSSHSSISYAVFCLKKKN